MNHQTPQPENIYSSVLRQAQERRDTLQQRLNEQLARIERKARLHGGR